MSAKHFANAVTILACLATAGGFTRPAAAAARRAAPPVERDISGTVADSVSGTPLSGGEVRILQAGRTIAIATTDAFGRYVVHNLPSGAYAVEVRYLGYRSETRDVAIAAGQPTAVNFRLVPLPINLSAVEVQAAVPLAVDTRTGNQIFKQNDYHGSPINTTSQILQQSIVGAARAPTGEVHIRGQHAEYTYYVDGVPVPSGISGSLNELFDPEVVNQIDFQTGGWDAEYGNKNAAIVNVTTRIPSGGFHLDASSYGGSFATNGQALNASTNAGKWGFFFSGARQATGMRREPLVFDTLQNTVENFHNEGTDLFGFAKAQYTPSDRDVVNLALNRSRTRFAVPFDSANGIIDDHQQDVNGFANLSWRHRFAESKSGSGGESELFTGAFFRDGSLTYTPGLTDDATFQFPGGRNHYTIPERDHFYEVGYVHRFPVGVVTKLSAYHKRSTPGIDDATIPGTAILTSVNIGQARITGVEGVVEIRPRGPVSAYVNMALNHAYGFNGVSGGFFPADTTSAPFDLDHDQRLSGAAGLVYSARGLYLSATGIYGSGLTNGNSPDATYGTGLLDFNKSIKVDPSFILNASAGYTFAVGGTVIRPQVYVENLFDHTYALKGPFFSGAALGRPRTVQLRLNLGV